ncbi:MAG: hypothetical protein NVSMB65_03010 [Chloroflexota bacterium]
MDQDLTARAFLRHVRNGMETHINLLTGEQGREDHGARSWWELHTRIASVLDTYPVGCYPVVLGAHSLAMRHTPQGRTENVTARVAVVGPTVILPQKV